jgi:double zinc ribbon protein
VELVFQSMEAAGIGFFVAGWAVSVIWTARDAQRRCRHAALRIGAPLVAVLVPFLGAAFYALVKPCEERGDVRARRLRTRYLETVVYGSLERCAGCATPLEPEFRCCPACGDRVRSSCEGCGREVRASWTTCPWCTTLLAGREEAAALSEVA